MTDWLSPVDFIVGSRGSGTWGVIVPLVPSLYLLPLQARTQLDPMHAILVSRLVFLISRSSFWSRRFWRKCDEEVHWSWPPSWKQLKKWGRRTGRGVDGGEGRKRKVCFLGQTKRETIRVQKRWKLTWSTKIVYFSPPLSNVISYDDIKQNQNLPNLACKFFLVLLAHPCTCRVHVHDHMWNILDNSYHWDTLLNSQRQISWPEIIISLTLPVFIKIQIPTP